MSVYPGTGNDSNPGDGIALDTRGRTSLRAAIQEANASENYLAGKDVIAFDLPGTGPARLVLNSLLPPITESVIIDWSH